MIPALLTYLIRKLIIHLRSGQKSLALVMLLSATSCAMAQNNTVMYDVIYKDEKIGSTRINTITGGDSLHCSIVTNISTRFIFSIKVKSVEESTYHSGKLVHSITNRNVNGNEKVNRTTVAGINNYSVHREGTKSIFKSDKINFNVMMLYLTEPVGITKIYSDNHQQFLRIANTGPHTYRLNMPDGNHNLYHYTNGVCTKVEVFSQLFDMQIVRR
ncbi:MAG: hypothetical protein EOO02_03820 [Chitinophagaceae bacterium]|nr:MAG: hypothetical protein EOO02_03820 [Chitinophagaceae bacterium]